MTEDAAVPSVSTTLLNDVYHATECATVFSLEARGLDLDFLDELERSVGLGLASADVAGFLTFHEERVFRTGSAIDLITGDAGGAILLERFVARTRSKLNDRLERTALRNASDDVGAYVGLNLGLCYVNNRGRGRNFYRLLKRAYFEFQVDGRQFAHFEDKARLL